MRHPHSIPLSILGEPGLLESFSMRRNLRKGNSKRVPALHQHYNQPTNPFQQTLLRILIQTAVSHFVFCRNFLSIRQRHLRKLQGIVSHFVFLGHFLLLRQPLLRQLHSLPDNKVVDLQAQVVLLALFLLQTQGSKALLERNDLLLRLIEFSLSLVLLFLVPRRIAFPMGLL
jgi:hypothetical protein